MSDYDRAKLRRDAEAAKGSDIADPWWSEDQLTDPDLNMLTTDARYVANFDPTAILALLDDLDRAEGALRFIADRDDGVRHSNGECIRAARAALPGEG